VKVDFLDSGVMDFGLGRAQYFKGPDGARLGGLADRGFVDDFFDFFQSAMVVFVGVAVGMLMLVRMAMIMRVIVFVRVPVLM
jgi:hypothetical protein